MFRKITVVVLVVAAVVCVSALALAAPGAPAAKTYQVTGPVLAVSETVIVVQKNDEKWELARTPDTKITGDLKVGDKVTIEYRMVATTVNVKSVEKAVAPKAEQAK